MKTLIKSIAVALLLLASQVEAATIYVDGDSSCPGTGATGTPYCTIQNALSHSGLTAGDRIKIRNKSTGVACYAEQAVKQNSPDGTLASPIIVEPDDGHAPCLRSATVNSTNGVITLRNVQHWIVQNLTFDASGITESAKYAIRLEATSARNIVGLIARSNTIIMWGGTNQGGGNGNNVTGSAGIISSAPQGGATRITSLIESNMITGAKQAGIRVAYNRDTIVRGNTISGTRCGRHTPNYYRSMEAIKFAQDNVAPLAELNHIFDNQTVANCNAAMPDAGGAVSAGIYCDTGSENGEVRHNEIHGIDDSGVSTSGSGIWWESRCNRAKIHHNVIYDIKVSAAGGGGVRIGGGSCTANVNNEIYHNTIFNTRPSAIKVRSHAVGAKIRNNIASIHSAGTRVIDVDNEGLTNCGTVTHIIDGNLYNDGGTQTKIGRWGGAVLSFASWKAACASISCDVNSPSPAIPLLVSSSNLSLTSVSPAIDACLNIGFVFTGSAPDCGAYEAIVLVANSGEVGLVAANKIVLNFGIGIVASPLAASNFATGWTARKNGSNNVITGVVANGNQLIFTMTDSYATSDTADLSYNATTGNLTDSSPFQNKQKFFSVTNFAIINNVQGGGVGGTFPVVESTATSENGSDNANHTTHIVAKPSGLASGDIWLVKICIDGNPNLTWPDATWLPVIPKTYNGGGDFTFEARYRRATGSEGSSIDVLSSAGERSAHVGYRISGAHVTSAPEGATHVDIVDSVTIDPPVLNPSGWGAEDALWIAGNCSHGSRTYTDDPDSYTNPVAISAGATTTSSASLRSLQRNLTTESENPGTFTLSPTSTQIAYTIAIRTAGDETTTPVAQWQLKNCAWLGYYSSLSTPVWVRPEGAANDMNVPPGGAALLACGIAVNLEDAEQTTIEWVTTKNGGGQAQITNNPAANGIGWGGNAFTILNGQSIESPLPDLTISPYSFITGAVRGSVEFNPSISLLTNTLTQFILILQIHRTAAVPTDRFCFIPKRPNNVDISLAIAAPCLEVANPGTIR